MRTMEWAAIRDHLGGVPRKMIFIAAGAFAKAVANLLNTTTVYNLETLLRHVRHRPPGVPLLTVANHMSTLDDPLMWGFKDFPITDPELGRWVLAAEDICFKNPVLSYCFRIGKCIPITRGGGIYQEHMNEALERLTDGAWYYFVLHPCNTWEGINTYVRALPLTKSIDVCSHIVHQLHTFPEGKVCQEDAPIRRLKWGTASLIARAPVTPIVLPIFHRGFEKVMPENYMFGRRPPFPLCKKDIKIYIGEPIVFDIPKLKQMAVEMSRKELSYSHDGWPKTVCELDEAAQRCLYTNISDQIHGVLEKLRKVSKSCLKTN